MANNTQNQIAMPPSEAEIIKARLNRMSPSEIVDEFIRLDHAASGLQHRVMDLEAENGKLISRNSALDEDFLTVCNDVTFLCGELAAITEIRCGAYGHSVAKNCGANKAARIALTKFEIKRLKQAQSEGAVVCLHLRQSCPSLDINQCVECGLWLPPEITAWMETEK